jgi:hypothetical protein
LAKCAAIKPNGERCKVEAKPHVEWCWSHHPDYEEARRRRASRGGKRGGRGRATSEVQELKALLADLTARVLKEEGTEPLETGPATAANQLINTRLRAIELERKIRETEELEARIEALEGIREGASRWGA